MKDMALVLGGGGARGAYEVGVLRYLFEDMGLSSAPRILCGTSAGAINACAVAASADEPLRGLASLAWRWAGLELDNMVQVDRCEAIGMARAMLGGPQRKLAFRKLRGSLLNPEPFRTHLVEGLRLDLAAEHIRAGRLGALCVTATAVGTGGVTTFVATSDGEVLWRRRANQVVPADRITLDHVQASSAIPFLLPPVDIDGRLYCDGSLRQHVPLSPALHLGADRIVVVSTQPAFGVDQTYQVHGHERAVTSPLFLLGRVLDALTLDRIDDDLERLERVNDIVAAGRLAFGESFVPTINRALAGAAAEPIRLVEVVTVRPSESLGRMAAEYVRGSRFRNKAKGGAGRLLERIADAEAEPDADLLSFLLFDGGFASELMGLGHADARKQRTALEALCTPSANRARRVQA